MYSADETSCGISWTEAVKCCVAIVSEYIPWNPRPLVIDCGSLWLNYAKWDGDVVEYGIYKNR